MAESEPSETTVGQKLFEIFHQALQLTETIENSQLPFNSPEYQRDVKKCIGLLEDSTRLVSLIGMFSANEFADEIPTENLQFLLLPFVLAQLVQKIQSSDREATLKTSQVYFNDFLKRCEDYEIIETDKRLVDKSVGESQDRTDPMKELLQAANQRNCKLEQFRKMKELEEQISALKLAATNPNVDDEIKRKLYMKQINYSIFKAREELTSIDQEMQMLEYRKTMKDLDQNTKSAQNTSAKGHVSMHHTHNRNTTPLRPIIITKDVAQKAVFGMGYPSLPVMTVAEFYEQRVQEGIFPDEHKVKQMNAAMKNRQNSENEDEKEEADKAVQETLVDNDDDENLARLRARDEYKDVVRRGDGNRHNRS